MPLVTSAVLGTRQAKLGQLILASPIVGAAGPAGLASVIGNAGDGTIVAAAVAQRVNFVGTSTTWLSTPPTITPATGSLGPITVDTNTTAHANFTPTTSPGSVTFTDTTDGNTTASLTTIAVATTYTVALPGTGTAGNPSTFTVALGAGALTTAVVVTPAISPDGSVSGTVTIPANTVGPAGLTFTATPAAAGTHTLSYTNNGGLTNQSNQSWSVTSTTPGTPGDVNMVVSPNAFLISTGVAWESVLYCGNVIKAAFTVPGSPTADQQTISLEVDVTTPGAWGAGYPTLTWSVDHGDTTYGANGNVALTSSVGTLVSGNVRRVALASGLAAGTHVLYLYIGSGSGTDGQNTWSSSVFKITRLCTAAGAAISTTTWPYARGKRWLHFGDSESGGDSWIWYLAEAMDAELANVSKNGIGLVNNTNATASSWPSGGIYLSGAADANVAWNKHWAGTSRMSGSAFAETPDYISVMLGSNDNGLSTFQASLTAFLQALRTAAPSAWIFAIPSLNRSTPFNITDAYAKHSPAVTAVADSKVKLIDLSTLHSGEMLLGMSSGSPSTPRASTRAKDGEHPYMLGDTRANGALNTTAEMAVIAYRLINALVNPAGGAGPVPQIGSPFIGGFR